ncbi:hypothetical protein RJ640_029034 [Escallonia rubra]|uniref:Uncharacterized protein n=1 Tax=Escallonia rubra TaxID=112253 RepID=A0AA88UWR3_9ASTE|nr:hypothetical protein RJ640_029034 [Escallonia rubra]
MSKLKLANSKSFSILRSDLVNRQQSEFPLTAPSGRVDSESWLTTLEQSSGPEVVAELAAEFRSEQDYLGECNKNRLLAAAECFAHAAIRRRSASIKAKEGAALYEARTAEQAKKVGLTQQAPFLVSRHTVQRRRRGGAVIYVITVFVGRSSGRALSFLCPIPSYQKRLTSYQPFAGCAGGPGTKNESISVHGSCWPAAAQLFERNAAIHPIEATLKGGPQARGSTKEKVSALRKVLALAVKERARHSIQNEYS